LIYIWSYIQWSVNCISFSMNIYDVCKNIYHPFSLECLNSLIEFLVELFRKMMIVAFFSFEIPKLNVMASPYVIICDFFVVKIQVVPFVFAHFLVVKDFQLCDLLQFINDLIPLLYGKYVWEWGSTNFFKAMCSHFLHLIKTKTLDYYFVIGEKVQVGVAIGLV
jgi:hypothetical protein